MSHCAIHSSTISKCLTFNLDFGKFGCKFFNDEIDGEMLTDQCRRGLAPTIHIPTPALLEMRTLRRERLVAVTDRTRAKNIIHSHLGMHGISVKIDWLLHDPAAKAELMHSVPS